jgi:hypothetical protein
MRCMVVYDLISEKVGMEITAARILPFVVPLLLEPQLGAQQVIHLVSFTHTHATLPGRWVLRFLSHASHAFGPNVADRIRYGAYQEHARACWRSEA